MDLEQDTTQANYLVGRDRPLQIFRQCLVQLHQGHGTLILIPGQAGIGKTALARQCGQQAQAQGATFALGRCYEYGVSAAFSPWLDVWAQLQTQALPAITDLPPPIGQGEPTQTRFQLMQAVTAQLAVLAKDQLLVLLLDDLHWADQDTLDLLEFATRHIERFPLLILATYRTDEVQRRHPLYSFLPQLQRDRSVQTISLVPLNVADITQLIEIRLGPCRVELAEYLHNRSEGNPLYLSELINDFIDRQADPTDTTLNQDAQGRWLPPHVAVPVPHLLKQVIMQRVSRLGEAAETFLAIASVVGEVWALSVVEAVLNWPEKKILPLVKQALDAHIIEPVNPNDDLYRFGHGLIRETLYYDQLVRLRQQRHNEIGQILENHPLFKTSALLAHHFYAAENWDKAAHYSLAAGDLARSRLAPHSARQFYEQALAASQKKASVLSSNLLLNLWERLGETHMVLNNKADAETAFSQLLTLARELADGKAEGRALAQLSIIYGWRNRFDQAYQIGREALELSVQMADRTLIALNTYNLGHLDLVKGELNQAGIYLKEAEQLAAKAQESRILAKSLHNQAYLAHFTGHYNRAERLAREAANTAKQAQDALTMSGSGWALAFAQVELGQFTQARLTLSDSLAQAEQTGEQHYLPKLLNLTGYLYHELGAIENALNWNRRALATCHRDEASQNSEAEHYSLLNLTTDHLYLGDVESALAYMREFETQPQTEYSRYRYFNRYLLTKAEIALKQDEPKAALDCLQKANELATATAMQKNIAKVHLLQGQAYAALTDKTRAEDELNRAVDLADKIQHCALRWKTRLALIELRATSERPIDVIYDEAWQLVETIAQNLTDDVLRKTFLTSALVTRLQKWASTKTQPLHLSPAIPSLTPREIEVLRLVATGATNRHIAETLCISVKTVDAHVTNILNKTTCDNRTAAAAFAIKHRLI